MKKVCLLLAVAVLLGSCVRSGENEDNQVLLMTWNAQNLFDGSDNGFEYDEFKEVAGWSREKYLGRINSLSEAVNSLEKKPDVLILQEIESLSVLEDLAKALSPSYAYCHFASNPGAALGVGVISRFALSDEKTHSASIKGEAVPRPVLEVRVNDGEKAFVVFACHWKSKLGGADSTEYLRKAAAKIILRRIRELKESEPDIGVIVAGDLNLNHDDFYRRGGFVCALMPSDHGLDLVQEDFLIISKNIPEEDGHFFSPWTQGLENGTYFYRNDWETIDHFLLSNHFFDGAEWEYERAFVAFEGVPAGYNMKTGSGLSDHLPLSIVLRWQSLRQGN